MNSRNRPEEEPGLFDDLPLHQDPPKPEPPSAQSEALSLFSDSPAADSLASVDPIEPADAVTRSAWRPSVPLQAYLSASLIDLGILVGVGILVWIGLVAIGVELDRLDLALLATFFLPFSFLYHVFPLAFWGCTPGMARVGLVARAKDGRALSFSQAAYRWLASVLTVLFLGLPLIFTQITGRSLADRLSDSQTLPAR